MQEFIIEIMNQFGYYGISLLIALENVFPPIPSEVILTFGGYMTLSTSMSIIGVILSSTIGSVVGAVILYLIGRLLTKQKLYRLVNSKIGKVLRFKIEDIDKSEEWFSRKGKSTVLFCRFIPIVRSLISIPAGMTKMQLPLFLIYTAIGSIIWNSVLTYLGAIAGSAWVNIAKYIDGFAKIILIVLIGIVSIGFIIFYKKRNYTSVRTK